MIKIRATLESKEDVIRELTVNPENNLEQLHKNIIKYFKLDEFEMASFYITDSNLDLVQEIPLFDTSEEEEEEVICMNKMKINSVLYAVDSQLIYIYDFLKMWRFYIEYQGEIDSEHEDCTKSIGEMPKKAPKIKFEEDKEKQEFDPYRDVFDDFNEFDDYEY